jgi:hypothetical protein
LVIEAVIQEDGRKQAEFEWRAGSETLDDLPGTLIFFVGVEVYEVEAELIGMDLGKEIATALEIFQIEELVFFESVHGFDIALVGLCGGRNAHVLAVAVGRRKIAFELAAVVGLPDQIAQRDAVTIQVLLDARSEDGAESGRTLLCKGQNNRPLRTSRAVY